MDKQITNDIMLKVSIKKAIGEGISIDTIATMHGMKLVQKILLTIVRNEEYKSAFYYKCLDVMIELEPQSREEYPELWI